MGIYEQFQTIVYDPVSGGIVKVLPNQYIKSRKKLDQLVPPRPTLRYYFFIFTQACQWIRKSSTFGTMSLGKLPSL